jgi:hypothetical protein
VTVNGWHAPHALDAREIPEALASSGVRSAPIAAPPREIEHADAELDETYLDVEAEPAEMVDGVPVKPRRTSRRRTARPTW